MCPAVVGGKDAATVEKILTENPFPQLELIHVSWKPKDSNTYTQKLREHDMITNMSRAFKLEQVDQTGVLPHMRSILTIKESGSYIIDISPASHAATTGVVYMPYLQSNKESVWKSLFENLDQVTADLSMFPSSFPRGPRLANA